MLKCRKAYIFNTMISIVLEYLYHSDAFLKTMAVLTEDDRFVEIWSEIQNRIEGGAKLRMCEAIDLWEARGEARGEGRGEARGIKSGINHVNYLNRRLIEDNRMEDLCRAAMDPKFQEQLMTEYGIK